MSLEKHYDAIVIGSGAAGSWAAKELTESTLEVLLLEAGREIVPDRDYPDLDTPIRPATTMERLRAVIRDHHRIQARCTLYSRATASFYVNDADNPYTTPSGSPFVWLRGRQLGGRLHTWSRVALRLSDVELKAGVPEQSIPDWPVCYADLAPYYDKVEQFERVSGEIDGVPNLPDGKFSRIVGFNDSEKAFKAAIESRWPERRVVSARMVEHNPSRVPRALRVAQQTGRLTIRSNAIAYRLNVDRVTRRVKSVTYIDGKTRVEQHAFGNIVILCASTIESLRVMLNSASSDFPGGIGNSSGILGRYLMDSTYTAVTGIFKDGRIHNNSQPLDCYDMASNTGIHIAKWMNLDNSERCDFLGGFGVQGGFARESSSWYLLSFGEMLPYRDNRVTLSTRKDAWGIPAAHIACSFQENEKRMISRQVEALHEMCRHAGYEIGSIANNMLMKVLLRFVRSRSGTYHPGMAIHEVGGARMGTDPATSVLNSYNQCWDVPNLFVTDGASFVTTSTQNPTLTIMALTARACHHIVSRYGSQL